MHFGKPQINPDGLNLVINGDLFKCVALSMMIISNVLIRVLGSIWP